jgi:hypothetical protein
MLEISQEAMYGYAIPPKFSKLKLQKLFLIVNEEKLSLQQHTGKFHGRKVLCCSRKLILQRFQAGLDKNLRQD